MYIYRSCNKLISGVCKKTPTVSLCIYSKQLLMKINSLILNIPLQVFPESFVLTAPVRIFGHHSFVKLKNC